MSHRVHYLIRFLKEENIDTRIFDISFRHETQSFLGFLRNILSFPPKVSVSSKRTIQFPSLPTLGYDRGNFKAFMHFTYSILEFVLAGIIAQPLDYNVIVATDPISALVAGAATKSSAIFVYEDLDYFEDLQPGKTRSTFISLLAKLGLKRADLVVSVSEPLLRRARFANSNCLLVPNGADLRCFPRSQELCRDQSIVYVGSMDEWAGLELVIRSFPLLKKKIPTVRMKIVGEGKEKRTLEALVRLLSLQDSVFFTGRLPYRKMAELLTNSSVGLAMFKPGNAAAFASPLKLFDYMAAGVPIIATDIGDIGRIVRESDSGFAIEWDIDEFVKAAESLLTKQDRWLKFHKNGLQYVEKYDWDILFDGWLRAVKHRVKMLTQVSE